MKQDGGFSLTLICLQQHVLTCRNHKLEHTKRLVCWCLWFCLRCERPRYHVFVLMLVLYSSSVRLIASICVCGCAHACASVVVNTRFCIHSTFANAAGLLALKILERGIIAIAFLFEMLTFLCTKTITLWSCKKTNTSILWKPEW